MNVIFCLFGAGLIFDGFYVLFKESVNTGVIITVILGVAMFANGILCKKRIRKLALICLCLELVFVGGVQVYGMIDTVTYKEEVLIVLGASLKDNTPAPALKARLDKAVEYADKNPEALIVVSGGQGGADSITEAAAMQAYLVEYGIKREQIIVEPKATSTAENMTYSKELLDERFKTKYNVAFVTNDFHVCRADMLAKKRGFKNATHLHAELQWYNYVPYYIRETMAMVKSVIFD